MGKRQEGESLTSFKWHRQYYPRVVLVWYWPTTYEGRFFFVELWLSQLPAHTGCATWPRKPHPIPAPYIATLRKLGGGLVPSSGDQQLIPFVRGTPGRVSNRVFFFSFFFLLCVASSCQVWLSETPLWMVSHWTHKKKGHIIWYAIVGASMYRSKGGRVGFSRLRLSLKHEDRWTGVRPRQSAKYLFLSSCDTHN